MPHFDNYREHVMALVQAALSAADPSAAVARHLHRQRHILHIGNEQFDLRNGRLFLVAVGKAASPMSQAALEIIGSDLYAGIGITKAPFILQASSCRLLPGNHPVPGPDSVAATTAVRQMLNQTTKDDLVMCLISGGASALLTQPVLPLAEWQALNQQFLASGCAIQEFNTVRRQLDAAKGGGLARWAAPAPCVSLILSDVVGNPLSMIGSGPTVPGQDTLDDALAILADYGIKLAKTPPRSPAPPLPRPPVNLIVGDVAMAATAAAHAAAQLGFQTQILTTHLEGEAREAGKIAAAIARDLPPNNCAIMGGETTVTLRGNGQGGRNQETALAAAIALAGEPQTAVASFATDGEDGPTQAAGAVVTGESVKDGRARQLNAQERLTNNDSHTYFRQLENHLIMTGSSGTNVNDLIIMIKYAAE